MKPGQMHKFIRKYLKRHETEILESMHESEEYDKKIDVFNLFGMLVRKARDKHVERLKEEHIELMLIVGVEEGIKHEYTYLVRTSDKYDSDECY